MMLKGQLFRRKDENRHRQEVHKSHDFPFIELTYISNRKK